jgi:hypothetical protein
MAYNRKKELQKLIEYAENQGFKINLDFEGISFVTWDGLNTPKSISLDRKQSVENRIYIFLHELGHHELRKEWDDFKKKFPLIAEAEETRKYNKLKRRIGYYVSSLKEEYLSWDYGYALGKSLGIKINENKWLALKNKCLMGYIRFFGEK